MFVARPGGPAESGFLVGYVWDSGRGRSEVVAFDTERAEAGPVARIRIPRRVPFGFHLSWFPETAEEASS